MPRMENHIESGVRVSVDAQGYFSSRVDSQWRRRKDITGSGKTLRAMGILLFTALLIACSPSSGEANNNGLEALHEKLESVPTSCTLVPHEHESGSAIPSTGKGGLIFAGYNLYGSVVRRSVNVDVGIGKTSSQQSTLSGIGVGTHVYECGSSEEARRQASRIACGLDAAILRANVTLEQLDGGVESVVSDHGDVEACVDELVSSH